MNEPRLPHGEETTEVIKAIAFACTKYEEEDEAL